MIRRLIRNELGSSASEYALIIGALGLAIVAGNAALSAVLRTQMSHQVTAINNDSGSTPTPTPAPHPTPTPKPTPTPSSSPSPSPSPTPSPSPSPTKTPNCHKTNSCPP